MKFSINRESLLRPLQQVSGVVERRQTLPILSNLLLRVSGSKLSMTGTDLEVEMVSQLNASVDLEGDITVPARKFVDICRELPDQAEIDVTLKEDRLEIRSGRFRSNLSTLPAADFPAVEVADAERQVTIPASEMKSLLDLTAFAMAQQDVRYFLNGMLIEETGGTLKCVATDGHRLAMNYHALGNGRSEVDQQVIIPRKGVSELQRLLNDCDGDVELAFGGSHLRLSTGAFELTTKLVDGRFPDYERVIPRNGDKHVLANKQDLRRALNRTAILSNEKFRGIRVNFSEGLVTLSTNNPEQEDAEETVPVDYQGSPLEIGFNVGYLLDVLNVIRGDTVKITVFDGNSSALIEDPSVENALYVIMPMKL